MGLDLLRTLFSLVAILSLLAQCSVQKPTEVVAQNSSEPKIVPGGGLKPPSDLALVMRALVAQADSVKAGLASDRSDLPSNPEAAERLTTATPTAGIHIDPLPYPVLAEDYQTK